MTAGKGDDLLDLALQHQRNEQVEQMDVSDDTGLEQLRRYGFQFLNFLASVKSQDQTPTGVNKVHLGVTHSTSILSNASNNGR